ncbi:homoserine dehydrogenase [Scardovia wiggsiae]|uniref:homoserine dehydrogenase n=1 Tax=Scardovia wiggsiae TaxID=230143 RepID=UPI0036253532
MSFAAAIASALPSGSDRGHGSDEGCGGAMRVALLGAGTVGSQVAKILIQQGDRLDRRIGAHLELTGIACRHPEKAAFPWIDRSLLTTDAERLCAEADIVIELIGGIEPARSLILTAFDHGASVVTANKALLALHGDKLFAAAARHDADLYYEAAVAGAVPVVRALRQSLAGDAVKRIFGIVNGTTNYILDEMAVKGISFDEALRSAQEKGFAEADPVNDIDGYDSAAKAAIMASLAFHRYVSQNDVNISGIRSITQDDIRDAADKGRVIKLLAAAERSDAGIRAYVRPVLVPGSHQLAGVRGSFNAVWVEAEAAGQLMFYGRGAGGAPTASAVVGDLVTVAGNRLQGKADPSIPLHSNVPVLPVPENRFRRGDGAFPLLEDLERI